jgi:ABC-type polysaccharide/polyol phosphate transport system ATPase subunit
MACIEVRNVWKQFDLQAGRARSLKEALIETVVPSRRQDRATGQFWALQDVSFDIEKGETFAIIGSNGSGKSTLLKMLTGISKPTRGGIGVRGRVSALLELGAGFHPDFTGRENTYLNGAILGLSRREIDRQFDQILAFSELERFIDNPVKTYSSGMYMRLAFSIAIHVDPDILVIDEVLAVGDGAFQQKCYDQIQRFKHAGKTIVFVSHSLPTVNDLCQRAAWLDRGVLRAVGPTSQVIDFYARQINDAIETQKQDVERMLPDGRATIRGIEARTDRDDSVGTLRHGEPATFRFEFDSQIPTSELDVVTRLMRSDGVCCYDSRTPLESVVGGAPTGHVSMRIPELRLHQGSYVLNLNLAMTGQDRWIDEKFFNFMVDSPDRGPGVAPLDAVWHPSSPA